MSTSVNSQVVRFALELTRAPKEVVYEFVLRLTDIDSPAEALHEQKDKDVKRNKVDDEHVAAPSRHLSNTRFNENIF